MCFAPLSMENSGTQWDILANTRYPPVANQVPIKTCFLIQAYFLIFIIPDLGNILFP